MVDAVKSCQFGQSNEVQIRSWTQEIADLQWEQFLVKLSIQHEHWESDQLDQLPVEGQWYPSRQKIHEACEQMFRNNCKKLLWIARIDSH